jgi:hypothetical protein
MPEQLHWLLTTIKVIVTVAVPVLIWSVVKKGTHLSRLFLGWLLLFLATVSLFDWEISLFSLYPERSASRYMYSPSVGAVVIMSWLIRAVWNRWLKSRQIHRAVLIVLAILYVFTNAAIVYKVTAIYRFKQTQEKKIYNSLVTHFRESNADNVTIHVPDSQNAPAVLRAEMFPESMLLVGTGREVEVTIHNKEAEIYELLDSGSGLLLVWDDDVGELVEAISPENK